jgi:hypothetical protein
MKGGGWPAREDNSPSPTGGTKAAEKAKLQSFGPLKRYIGLSAGISLRGSGRPDVSGRRSNPSSRSGATQTVTVRRCAGCNTRIDSAHYRRYFGQPIFVICSSRRTLPTPPPTSRF